VSARCLICLEESLEDSQRAEQHPRCLRRLFGRPQVPAIDIEIAKLHTVGLAMAGRASVSGVQRKISLGLQGEKGTFQLAVGPGRYILKPQAQAFPQLPENEHVTTLLAALVGLETPPSGLVRLKDGTLAYIAARFDRPPAGGKLRQEDFCQLAEKSPKEKHDGSAELCVRIIRRYASEPLVEVLKLYRAMIFAWWSGNGDMHLKNFSLLAEPDGRIRLSPAYDQVSTRLVIPDDPLALPVQGKKDKLSRETWREYAEYCGIPESAAARVLNVFTARTAAATGLISRSFLSGDFRRMYSELLEARSAALAS
jgi:serine/threonine-protein kinase HipA